LLSAGISCKISNKEKFKGKRLFGETRLISLVFFFPIPPQVIL